ncbi:unnamed protein product [Nezara viridula]|uniref:Cytochrome P450 n=1 Tax=Nezara viridula TaxID=85310 RepID=A0A9P0HRQ3_NEZVI|nr:unnamed protein product [Nezara viridula]
MMEKIVYAALTIIMAHLILGVVLWFRVRKLYSYPGVLGFPVIGNLFYFYRTLLLFTMDSTHKYVLSVVEENGSDGLLFHWMFGYNVLALISTPELVKKLSLHPDMADKSPMYGGFQVGFGGPFSRLHSGDEWKTKRKEYNFNLKKSRIENEYCSTFIKCADKMVNSMLASPSNVVAIDVSVCLTQDVSFRTLFGIESNLVYDPDIVRAFHKVCEVGAQVGSNPTLSKVLALVVMPLLNTLLGKKVAELRRLMLKGACNKLKSNQTSLKELPLSTYVGSRNMKNNESEILLLNELQELYFTSAHTVSTSLANTICFLAFLPDIQERAWQEQYEIFGNDIRDPTIDDLNQMQFLGRFIKESLRFLGPSVVGKMATADIDIDGITIPQNTCVFFMLRYIRFHPKHWKDPYIFDPDRFIEQNDSLKHIYSPFGIGIRNCPGEYFGITLMKIALSKIIRRLKVKLVDKNLRFEDIKYKTYFLAEMENQPKLQVEERI